MDAVSPVEIRHTPTGQVHQLAAVHEARPPVPVTAVVAIRHVQDVVTSDGQRSGSAPRQGHVHADVEGVARGDLAFVQLLEEILIG